MGDGRDSSYWVHKIWQLLTGGDPNATGLGISIDPGDIQIGAVEIKNNTDDTRAKVTTGNGLYVNLRNNAGTELGTGGNPVRTDPTGGTDQPVSVSSLPLPAGAASEVTLSTLAAEATLVITNTAIGDVNETAPATDTASSGLNGRLQRIAQRLTSLIALFPTALSALGGFKVQELAGPVAEDNTLGKIVVEHRYSYGRVVADGQIKGSAGFIHSVSFAPLAAIPTAGLITIYDSLTETGTVIYSEWQFATGIGHTIMLDVSCATGIYVGFDAAAANFQVTVSYR